MYVHIIWQPYLGGAEEVNNVKGVYDYGFEDINV